MTTSLQDAQRAIDEWQNKRDRAAEALARYEQEAGELVFAGGATGRVAGQLQRLRTEVDLAEAALQAAHRALAKVKAEERLQRLETLRASAAAVAQEEQEIADWLKAHSPEVDEKRACSAARTLASTAKIWRSRVSERRINPRRRASRGTGIRYIGAAHKRYPSPCNRQSSCSDAGESHSCGAGQSLRTRRGDDMTKDEFYELERKEDFGELSVLEAFLLEQERMRRATKSPLLQSIHKQEPEKT